jgi:site-specific DNA recombinase
MRAVIYARYSSDQQREASIEDQIRVCERRIEREGWTLLHSYHDRALSGASRLRPGYQKLLEDARAGAFDVIVSEALDRLSRDQEDVAALYKHLSFAGVKLVTTAEGEINELHVGLKGTMNALYLKDLAEKTRRGLEGRIRQGRSGGGLCYGYEVLKESAADGSPIRGGRRINPNEASVVLRTFEEFAAGRSPRAIAHELNAEGVKGPFGRPWGPSTIYGNWRRGTGILNNDLYIGRLVWNRQRFFKDPRTGRRIAKPNPETDWIITTVPELRIISDELWARVKERQSLTRKLVLQDLSGVRAERARRPSYLLSGLLKCGSCGGGFSKISAEHYGCSNARNRGICLNRLTIRRDVLEESVLGGLKAKLMHPDLVKEFVAEYHREINRLAAARDIDRQGFAKELGVVEREIREIIGAIKSGIRSATMASELEGLENRKEELQRKLAAKPEPPIRLHPNLAEVYRRQVENLREALSREDAREEAVAILRGLIDQIRLEPVDGRLGIYLVGNLAAILGLCTKKHPGSMGAGVQTTLVAGVGFEPTTFRL